MSILIKGMKMPRDCEECRFSEVIDGLGCMVTHYLILRRHGQDKPKWCPLIEVPTPHGRLIDIETLKDDMAVLLERNGKLIDEWLAYRVEDTIDDQATIIEAEEVEA